MFESDVLDALSTADGPAWSRYAPDGLLATVLAHQAGGSDFERLERIGGWENVIAWAQASQVGEIADYVASTTEDVESATAEACSCQQGEPHQCHRPAAHRTIGANAMPGAPVRGYRCWQRQRLTHQ